MTDLKQMKCVACRGGEPTLTDGQISDLMLQIPGWRVLVVDGVKRLERKYGVRNFLEAMALTQRVADAAEAEGHHPRIVTEWGQVTLQWWTHKIWGLHQNDFIMAAKSDQLYSAMVPGGSA